jgi:pimeloyl-ACP methyl ester carboxylesterase
MVKQYSEELVYTSSEDGIALSGVVIRPTDGASKPLALVWIHGHTGYFYERHPVAIGRQAAANGFTFVSGNNRGHDYGASLQRGGDPPVLGGGWWEKVEEAPFDVGAWVSFAEHIGFSQVVLAGHSLGTYKVLLYQGMRRDPRVKAIILGSPPVLALSGFRDDPDLRSRAGRLVSEGKGEELTPSPLGGRISAQTLDSWARANMDVFGVSSPEPLIARISCPLLVCLGTNEPDIVTLSDVETIRRNAVGVPRFDVRLIEGADHVYNGHENAAGAAIAGWLVSLA